MFGFWRTALLFTVSCAPVPSRAPQPNVLFISIDTLRADHLGAYGYTRPTSPRLDAFAKTAIVFDQAQSSSSWTLPSLASLMTSLYPSTHGRGGWNLETKLDESFQTLAEVLRNAGYDTSVVASQVFQSDRFGLQQGFTHVDTRTLQTEANSTSPEITQRGVEWLTDKAAVHDGVPWFLWLHYFDPHELYLRHPGYTEQFEHVVGADEMDVYDGEIAYTDHAVGDLLDELERLRLADDTVVVVIADHGEEFGEHGEWRHGYDLYQEVVHVPLIVRAPGMVSHRVERVVASVDVMPTLLDLCGVSIDFAIEGRSFLPLMRGESQPEREAMSELQWHKKDMRSLRVADWKYIAQPIGKAMRTQLYDLAHDPFECTDTTLVFPDESSTMNATLARKRQRADELKRGYGVSESSHLSAGEKAQLKKLGYVGDDE